VRTQHEKELFGRELIQIFRDRNKNVASIGTNVATSTVTWAANLCWLLPLCFDGLI
jgi:hypothetical protein